MMCRSDAVGDVVRAHLDATMWLEWEFEAISYFRCKVEMLPLSGFGRVRVRQSRTRVATVLI